LPENALASAESPERWSVLELVLDQGEHAAEDRRLRVKAVLDFE
jgi:hypothetical protein